MFKYIRKHQKKFLAFFGVALMITFVVQTGYSRGGPGNGRHDTVVANTSGDKPIMASEIEQARHEWGAVTDYVRLPFNIPGSYTSIALAISSIQDLYSMDQYKFKAAQQQGMALAELVHQSPEFFVLLRREARDAGARPNDQEVAAVMTTQYHRPPNGDES